MDTSQKPECGECSLCCTLLSVSVRGRKKTEYTPCEFCKNGCAIHHEKPPGCAAFECAYKTGLGERPDQTGVVVYWRLSVLSGQLSLRMQAASWDDLNTPYATEIIRRAGSERKIPIELHCPGVVRIVFPDGVIWENGTFV